MVRELDLIVTTRDIPERGIVAGDIGTVVHIYPGREGVEVEFVDGKGSTVAVETIAMSDVRPIAKHEILHVRPLETAADY